MILIGFFSSKWWLRKLEVLKRELELKGKWRVGNMFLISLGAKDFSYSGVSRDLSHCFRGEPSGEKWILVKHLADYVVYSRISKLFTLSECFIDMNISQMEWLHIFLY